MRNLRIYYLNNFPISYSSVNYNCHVVHYIPSTYLITGSLYFLIAFLDLFFLRLLFNIVYTSEIIQYLPFSV